ncbi:MAG: beta-lactamase family protein [Candidatus Eremiobacteraeota bacterium]|nr:beta-lactamase family protein [Candidatus Eremiobacteraeota bacterium]
MRAIVLSLTAGIKRTLHPQARVVEARTPVRVMRNARFLSGIWALVLLAAAPSPPPSAPSIDDALAAIQRYAPVAMAEQGTPGLSVAVTDRTRTLQIITLGYANLDTKTPVQPQTRFAIGSITKSMTALSVMELHDAGRIALDAPVQRYLPWFSIGSQRPILVHQLLSHTAGLPDDYSSENGSLYDVVALRGAKVLFPPGSSWSYSNDGFATLGAIVSAVDGRRWSAALRQRVLEPIGMSDSAPYFTPETLASAAVGYQWRDNDRPGALHPPLIASPQFDYADPAGSVLSTPEDMARYMRLYLNGGKLPDGTRLISTASFAAMTTAARLDNGKPAGAPSGLLAEAPQFYRKYGYGLSVFEENGDHLIGHTGGISGYTACMQMNLTRGFGVIAFANLVEAPLHPCAIVLYAMKALRAQSAGEALPPLPPSVDPGQVEQGREYAGTYRGAAGMLRVVSTGDHLSLADGTRAIALYPRGSDQFWADDPHFAMYLIAFGRDKHQRVVELTYGSQWYPNQGYSGPRTFTHPKRWDALVGRYENVFYGQPNITRVIIVKDRLTLDGVTALMPLKNGTFALGDSIVRFDAYAGTQPQRLWIDDGALYRNELP